MSRIQRLPAARPWEQTRVARASDLAWDPGPEPPRVVLPPPPPPRVQRARCVRVLRGAARRLCVLLCAVLLYGVLLVAAQLTLAVFHATGDVATAIAACYVLGGAWTCARWVRRRCAVFRAWERAGR